MLLFALITSIVVAAVGYGAVKSRSKFNSKVDNLSVQPKHDDIDSSILNEELSRIDELKRNLAKTQQNIEKLEMPTPESLSSSDNTQSSLDKISRFYEKHNLAVAGSEQLINSILPISQIGQSLSAMAEVLPHDIGNAVFGDALTSLKGGIHPDSAGEFLEKFLHGFGHLSHNAHVSVAQALEHHNYFSAAFTPIRSGMMEAIGMNDAGHNILASLHDIGSDMASAAESCTSVGELTSATDFDITGHIPVVTIALSSFREFKLLSSDKTNFISSLKNISLDVAGAGVGAAAGAKAGAVAGSMFGPIGTIIAGAIGAVGGAVGGRAITNKVKKRPLKKAIEAYETNYHVMKRETEDSSKNTLSKISNFANSKRSEFKDSQLLSTPPIANTKDVVSKIALALYQCIVDETIKMKTYAQELRKSVWYSSKKHETMITEYEREAEKLLNQLPTVESISEMPNKALDALMKVEIHTFEGSKAFAKKYEECHKELKEMNDKNDSSILMWTYMINNLYNKTLNDIAQFSNTQMEALNHVFNSWKLKMDSLLNAIEKEKGKLGLA